MKKSVSKWLRFLVSGILLGVLATTTNWEKVAQTFANLRLEFWLLAVALYVVTQIVSSVRWQWLARPLGFDRPLWHYVSFYFIGMLFNLLLPTSVGGDVVRAWYLDGGSGRRLGAFVSVFSDRFSGLLVLLALACGAAALYPLPLPGRVTVSVSVTAVCAVLGLVALPLLAHRRVLPAKFERLGAEIRHCLTLVARPWPLVLSLGVQAGNVTIVWLIGQAIDAPVPAAYYWILVPIVTLLTLLPSVNGMGVREWGTVLFLAPLGVEEGTAISLAFLWFATFTAASLLGIGFYLFGRFPRPAHITNFEPPLAPAPKELSDVGLVGDYSHQGRASQPATAA